METANYSIIIEINKDGWYTGQCAQIPAAISQAPSIEELKKNIEECIKEYFEIQKEQTLSLYQGRNIVQSNLNFA